MLVDILQREFGFVEGADEVEDVEGPAASLDLEFFEGTETAVGPANLSYWPDFSVVDNGDTGVAGNFVEKDIAADPSGATGGWRKRRADFDGGKRESEVRNENDRSDGPSSQVIVQDVEIRRAVGEDGALHLRISRVENFRAESFGLALQLKW